MLVLIARGLDTLLRRQRGTHVPTIRTLPVSQRVPREPGERLQSLPPDAIAAVPHHRRP
jgi:hypothetical protein